MKPVVRGLAALGLVCWIAWPAIARGHDIPNARVDRAIQVDLRPGRLAIAYEVSLSELTLVQDLRRLVGPIDASDPRALDERYGRETGPLNARGLLVTVDGRDLALGVRGFDLAVEEHPRFTFHFEAPFPPGGRLLIRDMNYVASEGTSRLALRASGLTARGYDGPEDVQAIPIRPTWQLTDQEEQRGRQLAVDFGPAPGPRVQAASKVAPTSSPMPRASRPPRRDGLTRLLDRAAGVSVVGLCALAFGLGIVHAIQPGHGKTLVAATVVGERGGWAAGVLLAIVTTAAHVAGVLAIAAALWVSRVADYGAIHAALARAAGFLIAAIGLWRLGRHLAGFGEHDDHGPSIPNGRRGIIGLGLAGGLVPCWDGILLIVLAEAIGRLALGLVLLVAFSLGMASVLVAVGLATARVRRSVAGHDRDGVWERRIGIAGGAALAMIGAALLA